MWITLCRALRAHGWLRCLCAALAFSSAGSGLTFIVVMHALGSWQAGPASFAVTFVCALAPGFAGSWCGERLLARIGPVRCMQLGEWCALIGVGIPWLGLHRHSLWGLQGAELVATFAAGLALPAIGHYCRARLQEDELPAAALIDTLVFGCQILFGIGLGVLLATRVSPDGLLLADAASHAVAIILLSVLRWRLQVGTPASGPCGMPLSPDHVQRRLLLLFPALAMVTSPAMALLPVLVGGRAADLLWVLFARALGQWCGPLIVREAWMTRWPAGLLPVSMAGFLACYGLAGVSGSMVQACVLVCVAHVLSNIVASLGWHGLLAGFDAGSVAAASALSYRRQLLAGCSAALLAGGLATRIGALWSLWLVSGAGLILANVLLRGTARSGRPCQTA